MRDMLPNYILVVVLAALILAYHKPTVVGIVVDCEEGYDEVCVKFLGEIHVYSVERNYKEGDLVWLRSKELKLTSD